jgi:quercetin dioxygenase-like cupin family protein
VNIIDHRTLAVFEMEGNLMTGVATPSQGAQQIEAWTSTMEPGAATPVHVHDAEEVVVVLRGRGEVRIAGGTVAFQSPCTLIAPAGVPHQIVNSGTEPLEAVAAMRLRSAIATADGEQVKLPWRE